MYSRVKRKRMQVKRDMYGIPIHDEDGKSSQDESESGRVYLYVCS